MAYTNSSLVSYTKISPNRTSPRNHKIDCITIHCVVGQCSVESLGNIFASASRQASSNYGIGYDGKIGMYVEEKDRSWCSSNAANDNRAVTIEVASDTTHPYAVTSKAMSSLIELVTDICKRNGIKKLVWSTNKNERVNHLNGCNMTVHRDYANKACPGDYLYNKHSYIANEVNKRLGVGSVTSSSTKYSDYIKILVKKGVIDSPDYWEKQQKNLKNLDILLKKIASVAQSKEVNSFTDAKKAINHLVKCGVINTPSYWLENYSNIQHLDKLLIKAANHIIKGVNYKVKVTADTLNIRKGAGTNYAKIGTIADKGIYTVVEEKSGTGATKWGLLKSYAAGRNGWISLDYVKKI